MTSRPDEPGPGYDEDFLECLRTASGWTDNPPQLTKSQAPRLVTIEEDVDSRPDTLGTGSDFAEDDEDSGKLLKNPKNSK